MRKIQKFSDLQPTIGFTEFDIYSDYRQSFQTSELGKIYELFPFKALAESIGLKESRSGRDSYFSPEGKIALMLLKSYTGLSDRDLIAQLNANLHYQIFCGVRINPLNPLINFKIVSEIRCDIGSKLNIDAFQQILASEWKPYLENMSILMTDATCYESDIRYPTDIKILWESTDWIYGQLKIIVKTLKTRMPRSKYIKQSRRYRSYCKKRKRSHKDTCVLTRSLLHLLDKLIKKTEQTVKANRSRLKLSSRFHKRLSIIKKVLKQQSDLFSGKKIDNRIVSIDKDYIRPIVRGKEIKRVEFGAKVNLIQVDGINFIEHFDFNAFNEGIRIPECIDKQQRLFRKRVTLLAADQIYATNYNRKCCTKKKITTSFVRKGRASKYEQQVQTMRNLLNKERSTRLEGSFGTEKRHYGLDRIKARTKRTETLWIFFAIHTANAVRMIPKVERARARQAA